MSTNSTTTKAAPVVEKLPSTNTNAFRSALRSYLAECTEVEGNESASEAERIAHMVERFRAEYGWAIPREGVNKAATDWLQGLAIGVEYRDHAIPGEVLKLHGLEGRTMTARLEAACVSNWWAVLAAGVVREHQSAMA